MPLNVLPLVSFGLELIELVGQRIKPFGHLLAGDVAEVRPQARRQGTGNFERIEQETGRLAHAIALRIYAVVTFPLTRSTLRLLVLLTAEPAICSGTNTRAVKFF